MAPTTTQRRTGSTYKPQGKFVGGIGVRLDLNSTTQGSIGAAHVPQEKPRGLLGLGSPVVPRTTKGGVGASHVPQENMGWGTGVSLDPRSKEEVLGRNPRVSYRGYRGITRPSERSRERLLDGMYIV